jgi:hypothetical protein
VLWLKKLREVRESPLCHGGNGTGEVRRDLTALVQKAKEAAQGGDDKADTAQTHPIHLAYDESGDVPWRKCIQGDLLAVKMLRQQSADYEKIVAYGRLREAADLGEILCETLFDSMKRGLFAYRSTTDDAGVAQLTEEHP